ncbi:hypothetical protein Scep_027493 [Stephania cephalantha]|uniref:Uncharacterized protein n=1 Tax=Stephania cephalantha TaxID=152367 RepID=A0AAP0HL52_9MAGN
MAENQRLRGPKEGRRGPKEERSGGGIQEVEEESSRVETLSDEQMMSCCNSVANSEQMLCSRGDVKQSACSAFEVSGGTAPRSLAYARVQRSLNPKLVLCAIIVGLRLVETCETLEKDSREISISINGLLLVANAFAILNKEWFLAPISWSLSDVFVGKVKSLKGQIMGLIYAIQYLRVPLIL